MAEKYWQSEDFKSKTLGEQRQIIQQEAAKERAAKEAAARQAEAEKKAYSKTGYYSSSFTQTERGTQQITKYTGSSRATDPEAAFKSSDQIVSISGTRTAYEGESPVLSDITPNMSRKSRTPQAVPASIYNPLTPRIVAQQMIAEYSPTEQRAQAAPAPNKYGAEKIEKADNSLIGKAKFVLSNANYKVSSFISQFKSKDLVTGKEDYLIGGTDWAYSAFEESKAKESGLRGELGPATGIKQSLLKFRIFSEKTNQFILGTEVGARERVRNKPVSVAGEFALSAGLTTAFSAGKLAAVKTAGFLPVLQKAAPAARIAGKVSQFGFLAAYGGSVAYNIGSAEGGAFGKGKAFGVEVVRGAAFAGGLKVGTRIVKPIEYRTQFELGLQKLPAARQAAARQEFRNLKSLLRDIPRNAQEPSSIDWGRIERLRGDQKAITSVKSFFKGRQDVVIGGSVAQRTQVPKSGRIKLKAPSDIDIYTDNPYLIKELAASMRAAGVKGVNVRGQKIYLGGTTKGFKAIEAHGFSVKGSKMFGLSDKNIFENTISTVKSPFKSLSAAIKQTPEGIYVQNIKYQAARKLYGGFEVSVNSAGVARMDRYTKDIPNLRQLGEAVGVAPRMPAQVSFNLNKLFVGRRAMISFGVSPEAVTTGKIKVSTGNIGGYKTAGYSNYYAGFKAPAAFIPKPGYNSYKVTDVMGGFYPAPAKISRQAAYPISPPRSSRYTTPVIERPYNPFKITTPGYPGYPGTPGYPVLSPPSKPPVTMPPIIEKPGREFSIPGIPQAKGKAKRENFDIKIDINNPFNPKYFSSIEATVLDIKGKMPNAKQLMSGFALRPIKI